MHRGDSTVRVGPIASHSTKVLQQGGRICRTIAPPLGESRNRYRSKWREMGPFSSVRAILSGAGNFRTGRIGLHFALAGRHFEPNRFGHRVARDLQAASAVTGWEPGMACSHPLPFSERTTGALFAETRHVSRETLRLHRFTPRSRRHAKSVAHSRVHLDRLSLVTSHYLH